MTVYPNSCIHDAPGTTLLEFLVCQIYTRALDIKVNKNFKSNHHNQQCVMQTLYKLLNYQPDKTKYSGIMRWFLFGASKVDIDAWRRVVMPRFDVCTVA